MNAILNRGPKATPRYRITEREVKAAENAFDLLVHPKTDPDVRRRVRRFRWQVLPISTKQPRGTLESLVDLDGPEPSRTKSSGLAGALPE